MLAPAGPRAAAIADIWWAMFWGGLLIQVVVTGLAVYALWWRGNRPRAAPALFVIGGGLVLPVVTLTALLVYGFRAGALHASEPAGAVEIDIVGRRFIWQAQYPGEPRVTVAGTLRIPVGEPVLLRLRSEDVIHSFWVPRLAGKQDLIPGRVNQLWLQADTPGEFHGQCAEFCGLHHAHMRFVVIALPRAAFDAWLASQRAAAGKLGKVDQ